MVGRGAKLQNLSVYPELINFYPFDFRCGVWPISRCYRYFVPLGRVGRCRVKWSRFGVETSL